MVTMISIAVLMVLVVGALRFTGTNRESAVVKLRADRMVSCGEAARRYLLSRLQANRVSVTSLQQIGVGQTFVRLPDDPTPGNRTFIAPVHYDTPPTDVITAWTTGVGVANGAPPTEKSVMDEANVIRTRNVTGVYFRVVLKCREATGGSDPREAEVEFLFRHEGV
jgi:hypothetical protein